MENFGNPMGTNITSNLASLKYFYIAMLRLRSTLEASELPCAKSVGISFISLNVLW